MKRTMLLVFVVATTAIVSIANASSGAGKVRIYAGTIGDAGGQPIGVQLLLHEGRPLSLSEVDFGADMTCDDGTSQEWFVSMGWGPQGPSLPSHTLDLDTLDVSEVLHLHGKVQAVQGAGTFSFAIAAFTADEQPQTCTTGELPWTVARTTPPVEGQSPSPSSPLQIRRFVTAGGVHVSMARVR